MSNVNLKIEFKGTESADTFDRVWATLSQGKLPVYNGDVSLTDILNMTTYARAKETAFSYQMDDGIYFTVAGDTINIPLTFYVFPSSLDLPYTLELKAPGTLSDRKLVNITTTRNVVVPLSDSVSSHALIANASFHWETPCYNEFGQEIVTPGYEIEDNKINFSDTVFGVLRGTFDYVGYEYTTILSFPKIETTEEHPFDQGRLRHVVSTQSTTSSITNIETSVICHYIDEDGEPQEELLELELPKAVENYLSDCPKAGYGVPKVIHPEKKAGHTTYYYSVCDGSILHTVRS